MLLLKMMMLVAGGLVCKLSSGQAEAVVAQRSELVLGQQQPQQ